MNLGPVEIGLITLAVLLLFGYKKLPDASRSLGRSLRIFKSEMKVMKDDGHADDLPTVIPREVTTCGADRWDPPEPQLRS
ncbi:MULTISPECIES: Sec-independent protein translocase subunit TatA [unclassified Blastococcus]